MFLCVQSVGFNHKHESAPGGASRPGPARSEETAGKGSEAFAPVGQHMHSGRLALSESDITPTHT